MRAVEGEGVPTTESSEMLAKGEGPMDAAEVVSGPHPEKLLEAKTPHGMASEKGNAVAEAGGDTVHRAERPRGVRLQGTSPLKGP